MGPLPDHPRTSSRPTGRWCVVGGAGFIGGHLVDALLASQDVAAVTVFDNFSSGREWHLEDHHGARLRIVRGDVADLGALTSAVGDHDVVVHLASNPDIAAAMTDPDIDFVEGTALTRSVVEAMRLAGTSRILYASGSGVYGELGELEIHEDHGPLRPVSTYGASKLAGEALISSYCAMFGLSARIFRFANVVGPRQTHGVGFDFVKRLLEDPSRLLILGDGSQSKSYIHIEDVIDAVFLANRCDDDAFQVFNVGTGDAITVTEIAELVAGCLGLDRSSVRFEYTGGDRGWKGDVPVVRLDTSRIRSIGWVPRRTSREAFEAAVESLVGDARVGRI